MQGPNNDFDMNGVSYSERVRRARREYELKKHDRESCKQIRTRINDSSYKNAQEVREHLELIEDLLERIKGIIQAEEREGIDNLSLKRDFSKIRALYNDLSRLLDSLEGF